MKLFRKEDIEVTNELQKQLMAENHLTNELLKEDYLLYYLAVYKLQLISHLNVFLFHSCTDSLPFSTFCRVTSDILSLYSPSSSSFP